MPVFEHIEFLFGLLLLAPLTALFVLVIRWKAKTKKTLGDEELIDRLTADYSPRLYRIKFIAVLIAIALCIMAAANLRKPVVAGKENTAGIDIMFALDVSKSMLSNDIKPSRLERAKQLVGLLVDKLENNRIGIAVFAGQAYLQMPLTPDITQAKMFIANASPDAVAVQGTVIGDVLKLCNTSLDTKEKKHKAVVLITDGEDHDAGIDNALQQLSDNGVVVYTIGIGTLQGSTIMEPGAGTFKTDENGKTVISKLNEEALKNIAAKTGGNYFYLQNVLVTANEVSSQLNGMEKKFIEGKTGEREYFSFAPFIIALAVMLLVFEVFIPETVGMKMKNKNGFKNAVPQ